jgi:TetR/AcrR family tetracycline transcriptional repressor
MLRCQAFGPSDGERMKINAGVIASTALRLLNDVGLDGLTMRVVAKELDVQAAALYWHVKNKQQLLDQMAAIILTEAVDGTAVPAQDWQDQLRQWARELRRAMLRYRDGARVFAGTNVTDPVVFRSTERSLRTMRDAGFSVREAARSVPALLHYTVGYTIEEQARTGVAYGADNPYEHGRMAEQIDAEAFPLTAQAHAADDLFDPDTDAGFERGLAIVLAGIKLTLEQTVTH